jgi:hypothetical protein
MQIFYVDSDPHKCAKALCNKHLIKGILESAQLLCTAHHLIPIWKEDFPVKFYQATYKNHPCAIWVRQCSGNYCWLSQHVIALCHEYTYRYDKIHASEPIAQWCSDNIAANTLGFGTNPPQCMPDEYKDEDTVKAYRRYYNEYKHKTITMTWTRRNPPEWWNTN